MKPHAVKTKPYIFIPSVSPTNLFIMEGNIAMIPPYETLIKGKPKNTENLEWEKNNIKSESVVNIERNNIIFL